jgi:hypothetical protein
LESLKTAHIIPDVISNFDPTATLRVQYGKQAPLEMGEQILPSEAADPPSVTFMGTDPQKVRPRNLSHDAKGLTWQEAAQREFLS